MYKIIKLGNTEYSIPTSWDDITLGHYQTIYRKLKVGDTIENISAYTNIPVNVIKTSQRDHIAPILNCLQFMLTDIETKQINEFTHNGVYYTVMQSLYNSQFQDYVSLQNIIQYDESNGVDVLHKVLAVMCRTSVSETLDDYDVDVRANEFKSLPFPIANNIGAFFLRFSESLQMISSLYSEIPNLIQKEIEASYSKEWVGKALLTKLRIIVSQIYIRYMYRQLLKSYNSIHISSLKVEKKRKRWIESILKINIKNILK
jgi:hypothetical protein